MLNVNQLEQDERYFNAVDQLRSGNWAKAIDSLRALLSDYPGDADLSRLMGEAQLKSTLDERWNEKITGRRLPFSLLRVVGIVFVVALVTGLAFGGFALYQRVIAPLRQSNALVDDKQALLEQARSLVQAGNYEEAGQLYDHILATFAADPEAQQGRDEVSYQLGLAAQYQQGMAALERGDRAEAEALLSQLLRSAPGYADVEESLQAIRSSSLTATLFQEAETAYAAKDWQAAIEQYEELRALDGSFQAEGVAQNLSDAHIQAGLAITGRSPENSAELVTAKGHFRSALALQPGQAIARQEQNWLLAAIDGLEQFDRGNYGTAIELWQPVYEERPDYLDGFIAEQMYLAYLELGDEAIKLGEREQAYDLLMTASALQVADKTDSRLRLESVSVLLTPSPTPTPTITPIPTATPVGTPEPTPAPPSIDRFKGWIAFLSDREGEEGLYVMRPDGSGQRRLNDDDITKLTKMREQERRSPDNTTRVFAMKGNDNDFVNLYKFREDLPANWEQQFRLTDWNGKSYDPVWAPDNQSIAFVSNSIRNDEIWRIGTDGSDPVRLTQNDWEWDKHPSWSSDSSQIVFYSNRTGVLQIWTMAPDGSGQRNLSGNEFNDWDPIWIK